MDKDNSPSEIWRDPIVAEVRKVREALFAESNYDIHEFCRRLADRQANSGHPIVKRGSALLDESMAVAASPPPTTKAG